MVPFGRAGRPVPPELRQQHQDLLRRIQGLRTRLQGGDPRFRMGEGGLGLPRAPKSLFILVFPGVSQCVIPVYPSFSWFQSTRSTWSGTCGSTRKLRGALAPRESG